MERGNQMLHVWSCLLPCIPGEATSSSPWPQPPLRRAPTRLCSTSAGVREPAAVKGKAAQNSASVFTRQPVWKCVCARANSSCDDPRARRIFQRAREGEKERRALPGMKFLAPSKLRVQLERFSLPPPSLLPPFPSLSKLLHFLLCFLVSQFLCNLVPSQLTSPSRVLHNVFFSKKKSYRRLLIKKKNSRTFKKKSFKSLHVSCASFLIGSNWVRGIFSGPYCGSFGCRWLSLFLQKAKKCELGAFPSSGWSR